jgi:hypothetical protein
VVAAWTTDLRVGVGYYTSELVTLAGEYLTNGRARPALWDALFNVAGGKNGQLDPRMLGRWLEQHLNRVSAGHKLLVSRNDKARPRWFVEPR